MKDKLSECCGAEIHGTYRKWCSDCKAWTDLKHPKEAKRTRMKKEKIKGYVREFQPIKKESLIEAIRRLAERSPKEDIYFMKTEDFIRAYYGDKFYDTYVKPNIKSV